MNLPISQISGLEKRLNKELSRMAQHWIDERKAAKREFAEDVLKLILP